MAALLRKEIKLTWHATNFIFLSFVLMLLIPSYPYYVAFFYTTLSIYFTFLKARENQDALFTGLLPIRKRDAVRARLSATVLLQLTMVVLAIPFAVIRANMPLENAAGIETNVAFFGLVLIMFGLFNICFIPAVYKTGYNLGKPFLLACSVIVIFVVATELLIQLHAPLTLWMDSTAPAMLIRQIPVLVAGIAIYALLTYLAYKLSARNYEQVDL